MDVMTSRSVARLGWLSFLCQTLIIATGGAVRLTGSGLGCSEWPLCTPESLIPTPSLGIHGIIEFGNRTLTGVVGIVAVAVLLATLAKVGGRRDVLHAVWFALGGLALAIVGFAAQLPIWIPSALLLVTVLAAAVYSLATLPERRDLTSLAWTVLAGVMAQAVVGGIAVITDLNAFVVGFHYTASLVLVCVTAAFLVRLRTRPGPRELAVPGWYATLARVTAAAVAVTVFFGVLTTSNGPHSGDADIIREGFDATLLSHIHSWPGYLTFALTLGLAIVAVTHQLPTRRWAVTLLVLMIVQICVGVWQANASLPPLLVGIHMVLAALTSAACTVLVLRLPQPTTAPAGHGEHPHDRPASVLQA
ncbi:heme A synthase [Parenemella sanctibonifatiensis]|uniref:Heme A synthase n=2 Tax=Parenemella sanctibonifatiensis TaxID=2016505 RepID=A0A255EE96_9ACTN|nr:heme A synthase [Parenemella sanctibonifatiensis]